MKAADTRTENRVAPFVEVVKELCKGCDFCIVSCPEECLAFSDRINSHGYRFAYYLGQDCTGCGICFYNCPEPGAITVYKKSGQS
jgi:NAD-dependent dihydropyrimidine dehydrogenase PreA subunit